MRIRFQFSLRTFLVVLVLGTATLGLWARRTGEQRRLVRILQGVGLRFTYDLDRDRSTFSYARLWLASRIGKDWLAVPIDVKARSEYESIYADDLVTLAKLRSLRAVDLTLTPTDDNGLAALARLPRLERLSLNGTLVTDQGLAHLDDCQSLRELRLGRSLVTPLAASAFAGKHPQCEVVLTITISAAAADHRRRATLRADRVPTAKEQAQLVRWIEVLESKDNFRKDVLFRELAALDPREFANYPPPDRESDYRIRVEHEPPNWGYDVAVNKLGALGLAAAIPAVERVARDVALSDQERNSAVGALACIGDRRIVPILIDLLEDRTYSVPSDAWVRLKCATGERIGEDIGWDPDPASENRRKLVEAWRRYWKENGDVVRPARAASVGVP
jgi:hypothetical protein